MPIRFLCVVLITFASFAIHAEQPDAPGATRIARWKDDKKAALMLMFDDSAPTHVKFVFPELKKRGMIATFYVNPGKWAQFKNAWETEIPAAGMEYGNHTWTHKGVRDVPDAEDEIGKCTETIQHLFQGTTPRLISYGQPGVPKGAWNINDAQLKEILTKQHLILRPSVDGRFAFIHLKTTAAMVAIVDSALEKGTAECVLFHGVGGDWLTFPLPDFREFLDKVEERRQKLWITGHISVHKYETERDGAEVAITQNTADKISLTLKSKADKQLYDQPLTLVTKVPATWTKCEVAQGETKTTVTAKDGLIQYDALPNGDAIVLNAAK